MIQKSWLMIHGFLLRAYNIEKLSKNGYKYDDSGEVNQLLRHSRLMHSDKLSAGGSSQFFVAGPLRRLLNFRNIIFPQFHITSVDLV